MELCHRCREIDSMDKERKCDTSDLKSHRPIHQVCNASNWISTKQIGIMFLDSFRFLSSRVMLLF